MRGALCQPGAGCGGAATRAFSACSALSRVSSAARAVGVAEFVAVVLGAPGEAADDLARIRVEQQLVRIEAMAVLGLIRPMRAQAVDQAGADAFEETVEDAVVRAVQRVALQFARAAGVEHAEFDLGGVVGEDGEVDAAVPCE